MQPLIGIALTMTFAYCVITLARTWRLRNLFNPPTPHKRTKTKNHCKLFNSQNAKKCIIHCNVMYNYHSVSFEVVVSACDCFASKTSVPLFLDLEIYRKGCHLSTHNTYGADDEQCEHILSFSLRCISIICAAFIITAHTALSSPGVKSCFSLNFSYDPTQLFLWHPRAIANLVCFVWGSESCVSLEYSLCSVTRSAPLHPEL